MQTGCEAALFPDWDAKDLGSVACEQIRELAAGVGGELQCGHMTTSTTCTTSKVASTEEGEQRHPNRM